MVRELLGVSSVNYSRPWITEQGERKGGGEEYGAIEILVDLLGDRALSINVLVRLACAVLSLLQAVSLMLAPLE